MIARRAASPRGPLLPKTTQNPTVHTVLNPRLPLAGARIDWGQLYGAGLSMAIAEAARSHVGPVLVTVASSREAEKFATELAFFAPDLPLVPLPDYETLPYDVFSPHPDITSTRLATLARLPDLHRGIVIAGVDALISRLPPAAYVLAHTLNLNVGDKLHLETLRERLVQAGYAAVNQVITHGEFAVRGSLLDLYPMGSEQPFRIDLFDDVIDSIRTFDPETQRSLEKEPSIRLLPAREFPLTPDAIKEFRLRYRARFEGDVTRSQVYKSVSEGNPVGGIEYYLPLFFPSLYTLFDYLPASTLLIDTASLSQTLPQTLADIAERYEQRRHDIERPILAPDEIFVTVDELNALSQSKSTIVASAAKVEPFSAASQGHDFYNFSLIPAPALRVDPRVTPAAGALIRWLGDFQGRTLIAAESLGRREVILEILRSFKLSPLAVNTWEEFLNTDATLCITVAGTVAGLIAPDAHLAIIGEEQLYGERARQERRRRRSERDPEQILRELKDLTIGAPVVHEDHGCGRYQGLKTLDIDGQAAEFLVLEYLGGDKLYVPVTALSRVARYTGAAPEAAPLHKLGGQEWQKARKKAAARIRDVAAELLDLYARRAARQGVSLSAKDQEYAAFQAGFAFDETEDQESAIAAVLNDLKLDKPMDRVVCGDVGFGKTEVALRAAFVAVQAGKQVAVLVPTTLLAEQHYQTFADRFADWPVRVASLSRFRSGKESQAILQGVTAGTVDIVVATHRLLQNDIAFKDLGLIIVDEEHRFGVRDKEKLKRLRADVDVLTLTATPIPRTLNMALGGLRDLSLITTPPAERVAVQTFVMEWNDAAVREACLREIRRGGQIYFLHNSVETIEKKAAELRRLLPEADVRVGHGQMRERDLEQLMLDFHHRRFNLLVCTTIIESGIDVPTANTILIDRGDRFGLAQLHQLRGRVGRSHHRAYCYIIRPPIQALTDDAKKRLDAIESLDELGAGFVLATHDLEIRGAGELLGDEQSGQITEIGFTLYLELLERAVKALQNGQEPDLESPLHAGPEINLNIPALLPDDYIPDVHLRLVLYKRISAAPDRTELNDLKAELVDRFGPLPTAAQALFRVTALKLKAAPIGIRRLEVGPLGGVTEFSAEHKVDPLKVLQLVSKEPKTYRLDGPNKLRFAGKFELSESRFDIADQVLTRLGLD